MRPFLAFVLFAFAAAAQEGAKEVKIVPIQPRADHMLNGPQLYREYCAVCHGRDARGDGPAAAALKARPTDLTRLAAKSGGKFPAVAVSVTIQGEKAVTAHGTREMPVWGPVFRSMSANERLGELRVNNLVKFIETLQTK
jgi:mono/diheme cytochrome c family protein